MTKHSDGHCRSERALAKIAGVTARAVSKWKHEAWWLPTFYQKGIYDVAAILEARRQNRQPDELTAIRHEMRVEKERGELELLQIQTRQRKRNEARELGQTLPADVYEEFLREWLGLVRDAFESLPFEISQNATPEQLPLVYSKNKKRPSKLQKLVAKKVAKLEQWLADGEAETKDAVETKGKR